MRSSIPSAAVRFPNRRVSIDVLMANLPDAAVFIWLDGLWLQTMPPYLIRKSPDPHRRAWSSVPVQGSRQDCRHILPPRINEATRSIWLSTENYRYRPTVFFLFRL